LLESRAGFVEQPLRSVRNIAQHLETFKHEFPQPLSSITTADVEQFVLRLKGQGRSVGTVNRYLARLRHIFNWAIGREYVDHTPFKRGTHALIKLERENNRRHRRLSPEEEERLLAVANPMIRALIVLALDTGMRQGEMLKLTFADVDVRRGRIRLRSETTKSKKERSVPIGTERLKEALAWLRLDAEGKEKPETARLCSNEVGEPIKYFRTDWENALIRAGIAPSEHVRTKEAALKLSEPLRWHDLRHEYASRLVERGVPLSQVRDLMGHASVVTTERYDTQRLEMLEQAVRKLETGKIVKFPSRKAADAPQTSGQPSAKDSVKALKRKEEEMVSRLGIEPRTRRLRVCCSAN
jgi:integrase